MLKEKLSEEEKNKAWKKNWENVPIEVKASWVETNEMKGRFKLAAASLVLSTVFGAAHYGAGKALEYTLQNADQSSPVIRTLESAEKVVNGSGTEAAAFATGTIGVLYGALTAAVSPRIIYDRKKSIKEAGMTEDQARQIFTRADQILKNG